MSTTHNFHFSDSRDIGTVDNDSIDLAVTSPPDPVMEMWDDLFVTLNPDISDVLSDLNGRLAFSKMHHELDKVWRELDRVVKPGGFVCINIGDAT